MDAIHAELIFVTGIDGTSGTHYVVAKGGAGLFVCLLKRGDQNPPSINVKLVIIGVHSAVRKNSDIK